MGSEVFIDKYLRLVPPIGQSNVLIGGICPDRTYGKPELHKEELRSILVLHQGAQCQIRNESESLGKIIMTSGSLVMTTGSPIDTMLKMDALC